MCKRPAMTIQEQNELARKFKKEIFLKKELQSKSEADKLICRRCKKEVGYLQNGLCNGCIDKVSFMDYWQLETPEEAVRLSIVQDLNKEIYNGNEKAIKKLKPNLVNGRLEEIPNDLEKLLKKEGVWEGLLENVQKIYPEEEEISKEKTELDYLEEQLGDANEKLEDINLTIKKLEREIDKIKTLEWARQNESKTN